MALRVQPRVQHDLLVLGGGEGDGAVTGGGGVGIDGSRQVAVADVAPAREDARVPAAEDVAGFGDGVGAAGPDVAFGVGEAEEARAFAAAGSVDHVRFDKEERGEETGVEEGGKDARGGVRGVGGGVGRAYSCSQPRLWPMPMMGRGISSRKWLTRWIRSRLWSCDDAGGRGLVRCMYGGGKALTIVP